MALRADDTHHTIYRAAPTDFYHIAQHIRIGRFANQTIINNFALRFQPAKHFARAVNAGAFFIAGDEKRNRAADFLIGGAISGDSGGKGGNRAFHISRAASPKGLFANFTGKRVVLPIIGIADRHDISVTGKANMRAFAAQSCIKIINRFRAVFLKGQARASKTEARQRFLQQVERARLGRGYRRTANKLRCKFYRVDGLAHLLILIAQ